MRKGAFTYLPKGDPRVSACNCRLVITRKKRVRGRYQLKVGNNSWSVGPSGGGALRNVPVRQLRWVLIGRKCDSAKPGHLVVIVVVVVEMALES